MSFSFADAAIYEDSASVRGSHPVLPMSKGKARDSHAQKSVASIDLTPQNATDIIALTIRASPSPADPTLLFSEDDSSNQPPPWKAGRNEWMVVIDLAIVSLMVALDATILVPVLPAIGSELHGTAVDTFWAGTAYLLTQSVFQPFLVSLSDIFSRRLFYLISLAFFAIGTLICCLSHDFAHLLAGRSIQGIGGGGIVALSSVILTDIVPLRERPIFVGVLQISWALGSITGPLIGGLLVRHTTWRWIFYLNFPFCAIGFLTIPLVLKLHVERGSVGERLLAVDWLEGFLFISSTCSFLIGITWGGSEYPWSSWRTLTPLIAGLAGMVATVLWEQHGAKKPFLRLELFNSYSAISAYFGAITQGFLMCCELYYIPFYLESVKDFNPTVTGVSLIPLTGALIPVSIAIGRLLTKYGRFRWAIWLGWVVIILGTGLLILLDVNIRVYAWVMVFVVVGVGHGLVLMSLNFSVQAMCSTANVAYASAMYTFLRNFGMCLGVAVGGVVFQNELVESLGELELQKAIANEAESFVGILKTMPKSSAQYQAYIRAYADAFRVVFEVLTGLAGLAGLLSIFIKEYTMDKALDSEHVLGQRKDK